MGSPVRSHETVCGMSGKGMSKGGPLIISDIAERAPKMLARAISRVPNLRKRASPVERDLRCLKEIFIFFAKYDVFFTNLNYCF